MKPVIQQYNELQLIIDDLKRKMQREAARHDNEVYNCLHATVRTLTQYRADLAKAILDSRQLTLF